jgi:hypothetical protein
MQLKEVNMLRLLLFNILLQTGSLATLVTVDATVPIRPSTRHVISGSSGGSGYRLPVELKLLVSKPSEKAGSPAVVDFLITNTSARPIVVPVWLHQKDLEPNDNSMAYSFEQLSLFVTTGTKNSILLKGGADLYGSPAIPNSLVTLSPMQSVQVHATISLATLDGSDCTGAQDLTAKLILVKATIRPKGPDAEKQSEDVGSAFSRPVPFVIEK